MVLLSSVLYNQSGPTAVPMRCQCHVKAEKAERCQNHPGRKDWNCPLSPLCLKNKNGKKESTEQLMQHPSGLENLLRVETGLVKLQPLAVFGGEQVGNRWPGDFLVSSCEERGWDEFSQLWLSLTAHGINRRKSEPILELTPSRDYSCSFIFKG